MLGKVHIESKFGIFKLAQANLELNFQAGPSKLGIFKLGKIPIPSRLVIFKLGKLSMPANREFSS